MDTTDNLHLPCIMPAQAQKHVTHNEALRAIDALLHLAVVSRAEAAPPPALAAGERHIVAPGASGAWAGQDDAVAVWQDGAWAFHRPRAGWLAFCLDEQALLAYGAAGWEIAAFQAAIPERLGVNATADAPNRLALAGAASLFDHEGAGHQLKVNKAAASSTASVLFQTGYSGRAELGLAGDDDFHVKVSADGAAFTEAMIVSRATGRVSFPAGVAGMREQLAANRTYYVSPSGSNANSGLSAGSPFATLQKAVDEAHRLDCSIYNVTIQLAAGSYAGAIIPRPLFGGGTLFVVGDNATPANVVLTSGTQASGGAVVSISGVRFALAVDYHHALSVQGGARLLVGKVDFGPTGLNGYHVNGSGVGEVVFEQDYAISGNARRHIALSGPVVASSTNRTVTLTDAPAFDLEFLYVSNSAVVTLWNPIFIGSATGRRYSANTTGVINLYGKGATFLPGDAAGVTANGGVYA